MVATSKRSRTASRDSQVKEAAGCRWARRSTVAVVTVVVADVAAVVVAVDVAVSGGGGAAAAVAAVQADEDSRVA